MFVLMWLLSKKAEAASVYQEVTELQSPRTQTQQLTECAIAAGIVAMLQGEMLEIEGIGLTYRYANQHGQIVMTGPNDESIRVIPKTEQCKTRAVVATILECFITLCIDTGSHQVVSKSLAKTMVTLVVNRIEHETSTAKLPRPNKWKILGWENNMIYQWMKYSAKQVSDQACITCYNPKRKPIIKPLPGFGDGKCDRADTCLAECTLNLAAGAR